MDFNSSGSGNPGETESVTTLLATLGFGTCGLSLQTCGPQLIGKKAGRTENPNLIV